MNDDIAAILSYPTLTPREVQRVLRSSRSSTGNAIRNGTIPSFRIDNNIKVPTSWILTKLGLTTKAA
jgi:hypothetical protein